MESTNQSEVCLSVGQAKKLIGVYAAFPVVAIVSDLAAIIMIIKRRACRSFVHRLTLYLAISDLFLTLALWFRLIPVDIQQSDDNTGVDVRNSWDHACVFSGFLSQYSGFVEAFIVVWLSLYVFVKLHLQKNILKRKKVEIAALFVSVIGPLVLLCWEPFIGMSYGLNGMACWIKDKCHSDDSTKLPYIFILTVNTVPHSLLKMISLTFILVTVASLVRKAAKGFLKNQYWLKVKDALLIAIFPALGILIFIGRLVAEIVYSDRATFYFVVIDAVSLSFVHTSSAAIPISLLLQSSFRKSTLRQNLKLYRKYGQERETDSDYLTLHQSDDKEFVASILAQNAHKRTQ